MDLLHVIVAGLVDAGHELIVLLVHVTQHGRLKILNLAKLHVVQEALVLDVLQRSRALLQRVRIEAEALQARARVQRADCLDCESATVTDIEELQRGSGVGECHEYVVVDQGGGAEHLAAVEAHFSELAYPGGGPLKGKRILITSGPTHEPIDPVRYIANRSSGIQGFAIARPVPLCEVLDVLRGDGFIISTPTGSTGYAMSVGGPIIHPNVNGVVIAPMLPSRAAHALPRNREVLVVCRSGARSARAA